MLKFLPVSWGWFILNKALLLIISLLAGPHLWAQVGNGVPHLLPYQGMLTDADGVPVNIPVTVSFRVLPPAGTCYIYEDTQFITPNSFGVFSVLLGIPGNSTGPANDFVDVFNNDVPVALPDSCAGNYSPATNDWRRIQIVIEGEPMPQIQTVGSSAFAFNAEMLEGRRITDLIQVNGDVTQANLNTLVDGSDAGSLHHHDGRYVRTDGSNSFTGNVVTTGSFYSTSPTSQIGVGTTSANADIDILKDSPSFRLGANSGSGGTPRIDFFSGTANQRASIQSSESDDGLTFYTGTNEAFRLDDEQNAFFAGSIIVEGTVGIGRYDATTEPALLTFFNSSPAQAAASAGTVWTRTDMGAIRYWDGSAAQTLASSAGSVSSVTAGTGITNSGTVSDPILNVDYGTTAGTAIQGNATFGGDLSGQYNNITVQRLQGVNVDSTPPADGQVLTYNAGNTRWEPTASGLRSLNGLTDATQSFAVDNSVTSPGFSSAGSTHTLGLPMASTAGATAGMISKTEYDTFAAKQDALGYNPVNRAGDAMSGDLTLRDQRGIIFNETDNSNYVSLRAPASLAGNVEFILPDQQGSVGEFLAAGMGGQLQWVTPSVTGLSLANGLIWIGDGSNQAAAVAVTGDVTISNTGVTTIGNSAVTTTKLDNLSVTEDKLANNAVTTDKINNVAVTDAKISGVSVGKIDSGAGQYFTYEPNGVSCADGQLLSWNMGAGYWECTGVGSVGAITEVLAGAGLGGGGTTTSVSLYIDNLGVQTGMLANESVTTGKLGNLSVTNTKLANDAVTSDKIQNDAVTTVKLVNLSVTNAKLADGAVSTIKIQDDAVTTDKIVDGAVTNDKIVAVDAGKVAGLGGAALLNIGTAAGTVAAGDDARFDDIGNALQIQSRDVASNAPAGGQVLGWNGVAERWEPTTVSVTGMSLANGLIWIGDGTNQASPVAVSGDISISNTGVTTIGNDAVTTTKIENLAVTDAKLADNAVTTDKINNGAVTDEKITTVNVGKIDSSAGQYFSYAPNGLDCANGEILSWSVADTGWVCAAAGGTGTITEVAAGAGLVGGGTSGSVTLNIDNLGVSTAMLANLSVTETKLATDAVTTTKVANLAVTTDKLADLAVTDAKLAADSVTTAKIENLAVTTDKLANLSVTEAKLVDNAVTTAKINNGAVTDDKIANVDISKVDGLGTAAALNVGTAAGTVAAGDDARFEDIGNAVEIQGRPVFGDMPNDNDVLTWNLGTGRWEPTAISITGMTLTDGQIWIGDGSDQASPVAVSGDISISNTGVTTIGNDAVTTAKIENLAVNTDKLANLAVTDAKLADNAVTTDKISNGAVTDEKITTVNVGKIDSSVGQYFSYAPNGADCANGEILSWSVVDTGWVCSSADSVGAITEVVAGAGLVGGGASGSVTLDIDNLGVSTAMLANLAVTDAKLAADAVTTTKVANLAVTTDKLANSAVTDAKLAADSVTTAKIENLAVTTDKLANTSVTDAKLADNAVTTAKINNGAVTDDKITNVDISKVDGIGTAAALNVGTTAGTVAAGDDGRFDDIGNALQIQSRTVASDAPAGGQVLGWNGVAERWEPTTVSVTGMSLANGLIWIGDGSDQASPVAVSGDISISNTGVTTIGNDAVTTVKIENLAVNTDKLANLAVTDAKLADNAVTTDKINNGAVTDEKITTVNVSKIDSSAGQYFSYAPNGLECGNGEILSWSVVDSGWVCAAAGGTGTITEVAAGAGLVGGGTSGSVTLDIDNLGVSTAMLANLAVTDAKLAADAVTTTKVANLAVTEAKLAADSVTTTKIENLAVTTDKLANLSVTDAKLADNAVTTAKINNGAVTDDKISNVDISKVDGIGTAAALNVGTTAGTVAAGDDGRFGNALQLQGRPVLEDLPSDNDVLTWNLGTGRWEPTAISITGMTLTDGQIWIGDGSDQATPVAVTGDISISNTGVSSIGNNAITTAKIENLAVNTDKLANLAVTEAKLADNAVTTAKINNGAVTDEKINTVNVGKIESSGGQYFSYAPNGLECGNGEILSWSVADTGWVCTAAGGTGTITEVAAGAGLVGGGTSGSVTLDIDNLGVSTAMLANLAVTDAKLATDAVTTTKVANLAVTTDKLANLSVTDAKLAADSVTTTKIENLAVTTDKLANTSVTDTKLADNAVTTNKINNGAVTDEKIANVDVSKVDGLGGAALLEVGTTTGTVAAGDDARFGNALQLQGRNISSAAPGAGQVLTWNNGTSLWEPAAVPAPSVSWGDIDLTGSSLADLATRDAADLTGTLSDGALSANVAMRNTANTFTGAVTLPSNGLNVGSGQLQVTGGNVSIANNLTVNGDANATAYYYTSDQRLKKDIELTAGLELILLLRGVNFNWKSTDKADIGFIAQEVEAVAPDLVHTNPETGMKSVKYGNITAPLVEATKELYYMCKDKERDFDKLEKTVEELKEENKILRQEIEEIKHALLGKK
jgi:hypothetical protein